MNKTTGIIIGILAIAVIGGILLSTNKNDDAMMVDQNAKDEAMMESENQNMMTDDVMMEDTMTKEDGDTMMEKNDTMMKAGSYESYSPEKIARAENSNVVLFFRASWCPTCITLDKDIRANLNDIPSDLSILDVDYDNSTELKKKYGVTYQHTFVQVDKDGNMIKKWSGSPTLQALISEVK